MATKPGQWKLKKQDESRIQAFENMYIRRMMRIIFPWQKWRQKSIVETCSWRKISLLRTHHVTTVGQLYWGQLGLVEGSDVAELWEYLWLTIIILMWTGLTGTDLMSAKGLTQAEFHSDTIECSPSPSLSWNPRPWNLPHLLYHDNTKLPLSMIRRGDVVWGEERSNKRSTTVEKWTTDRMLSLTEAH